MDPEVENRLKRLLNRRKRYANKLKTSIAEFKQYMIEDKSSLVEGYRDNIDNQRSDLISIVKEICEIYQSQKMNAEIEAINNETEDVMEDVESILVMSAPLLKDKKKKADDQKLTNDSMHKLKPISIQVFSGNKRTYEHWKSVFDSIIDNSNSSDEFKFLQLKQYLSGEPLKSIEALGHSAEAYEAAKELLDRKYGGKRRQIQIILEDVESFPTIRAGKPKDLEKLADLLDILIVNLKAQDMKHELGEGSLYLKLKRKLPESMITNYQRWIHDGRKKESVTLLKEFIVQETEYQTVAYEVSKGVDEEHKSAKSRTHFSAQSSTEQRISDYVTTSRQSCIVCNQRHSIWQCNEFKGMTVNKRWEIAKKENLCFRCLQASHIGKDCKFSRPCGINNCEKIHNRLLHFEPSTTPSASLTPSSEQSRKQLENKSFPPKSKNVPSTANRTFIPTPQNYFSDNSVEEVSLRIIPVILKHGDKRLKVNALLDDGSTKTYVNSDVVNELGVLFTDADKLKLPVSVLNDKVELMDTMPVELGLESLDGKVNITVNAFTTDRVTGNLKPTDWKKVVDSLPPHLQSIEFPSTSRRQIVDLLIGIDHADLHFSYKDVKGEPGGPIARLTPLGWTCIGNVPTSSMNYSLFARSYCSCTDLNETVRRFWEIENVPEIDDPGRSETMSVEDRKIYHDTEKSLQLVNGRYQVDTPWKANRSQLKDNYDMAMKRLISTEKQLSKKGPTIASTYNQCFEDYLTKGYISRVEPNEICPETQWYLPHFPIIKPDRVTTKVRIVFDASAKSEGVSLNDVIHQGPKLQQDLINVLTRFRRYPVAVTCDIAEMYLQIQLNPKDRSFHRFLWRYCDTAETPSVFEFNRVVFGVNSSPFLAQFVSQQHAMHHQTEYPRAAECVLNSTYMDDCMDSVVNDTDGMQLFQQLHDLWTEAGMYPRKWLSNSSAVVSQIPVEDRAQEFVLSENPLPSVKTLGLVWEAENDKFTFKSKEENIDCTMTKRLFLSRVSTVFDPCGFLSPVLIRAKILLQEIWASGVEWDSPLEQNFVTRITAWLSELKDLSMIKVDRCIQVSEQVKCDLTLHTFVDASVEAYGALVYAVSDYNDVKCVKLVASKTRVAPLKAVSIPRLELTAAVLGLKLALKLTKVLCLNVRKDVTFWSDSLNVLHWIRNTSRSFKPFVANRIGYIHEETEPEQWRHVPGRLNVADCVTRSKGMSVSELADSELWWKGPDFLTKSMEEWPQTNLNSFDTMRDTTEYKHKNTTLVSYDNPSFNVVEIEKCSDWNRLVRIQAWINRFVQNCSVPKNQRITNQCLSTGEFDSAEIMIIRNAQKEAFTVDYFRLLNSQVLSAKSKLIPLRPRIDHDGLLRCDGRLKYADYLSHDVKYPVILPRNHRVTKLIIKLYHEGGFHACGTNQTLAALSARFWIVSAREAIRELENECTVCKKNKARACEQVIAPLPVVRTEMSLRAFSSCAVDFAGPFVTIQGRGKTRNKRYLCLFTCLQCRAVHLEMAFSLDTDAFLNAFSRMAARRGVPEVVYSDNGTNFVSGERELRELVKALDAAQIENYSSLKGISWTFNPPLAPHFGGAHEIMIKAAKKAIVAILASANINDEELMTAFIGAEGLLNSRPLTYQSANSQDVVPLTPNHFLFGQVGGKFAPESVDTTGFNPRKRWRRVQELIKHVWSRWMKEWLPLLNSSKKWNVQKQDIKKDDIVLVIEPSTPRGNWKLGKVISTFPGKDGHTRVALVKVGNSEIKRPISKLCHLDIL